MGLIISYSKQTRNTSFFPENVRNFGGLGWFFQKSIGSFARVKDLGGPSFGGLGFNF